MKKIITMAVSCAVMATLTGCASIAGNNSRAVNVHTTPEGASIYVDNQEFGVSPTTITLPTYIYGGKNVTVKKAGYRDQTLPVNTAFQPIAILDILLWPTLIIDAATGNLVKIDPASTNLNFRMQRA